MVHFQKLSVTGLGKNQKHYQVDDFSEYANYFLIGDKIKL